MGILIAGVVLISIMGGVFWKRHSDEKRLNALLSLSFSAKQEDEHAADDASEADRLTGGSGSSNFGLDGSRATSPPSSIKVLSHNVWGHIFVGGELEGGLWKRCMWKKGRERAG